MVVAVIALITFGVLAGVVTVPASDPQRSSCATSTADVTIGAWAPAHWAALGAPDPSRLQSSIEAVLRRPVDAAVPIVATGVARCAARPVVHPTV